ncbi:MAG: Tar ligand binding domain-containing protein [Rhodocyclaceae bacterium]|nr:Tar ligand binding domain-containing protein [Rhodocyclaceae bacterium]MBX3668089.1 Tar ligand binding domain-containing protein [Rhodocyclaceae bacterium]
MLNRFSVKTRLMALMVAILGMIAVGTVIGLGGMHAANNGMHLIYSDKLEPTTQTGRMLRLMNENRAQVMLALQHNPESPFAKLHDHPVDKHLDAIAKNRDEITSIVEAFAKRQLNADERSLLDQYAAARTHYVKDGLAVAVGQIRAGDYMTATRTLLDVINPAYAEASKKAETLLAFYVDSAKAENASLDSAYRWIFAVGLGLGLLAIVLVLITSLAISHSITRPLDRAVEIADAIAADRLDNRIEAEGKDELAALLTALARMQQSLSERMGAERETARESLRIRNALDKCSTNVMLADTDGRILYLNEALGSTLRAAEADIRKDLPSFSAAGLLGRNFDDFHRNPGHQRQILAGLTGVHRADIAVGGRSFRLTANPVVDAGGARIGTVLEWLDRTQEVAIENELADVLTAATRGDFSRRLALEGKQGFFREVAAGLNELTELVARGLREVAGVLNAISRGELNEHVKGEYAGTFGQLKDDTNATVDRLREVVGQIQEASEAINTAASEIAAGNRDLSARTEEQASSLEETASSMEELNATVRQNAENAQRANTLAASSNDAARRGGETVHGVVETMGEIQRSAQKIADIIGVIDSIAFQTNILALNAAVEAARAGEQGRGFAVVASEVRALAQRSAQAAREIKTLISASVENVNGGVKLVSQAGKTIEEVVASFGSVADLVTDISSASREQSSGIEQVTVAVNSMDEVTQQNAALVEQAAAAAESLEEQAQTLARVVAMFRIGQGGGASASRTSAAGSGGSSPPPAPVRRAAGAGKVPASLTAAAPANDEWEEF